MTHEAFMRAALAEAQLARAAGELPVGCVVVRADEIIARAHNERERSGDPTAHAEILALRRAARALGGWRLDGCTLYVTLEPCPMCAGAIVQARVSRLVFGAYDPGQGCAGSVYRITEDPAFTHFCPADGGVLEAECRAAMEGFFAAARAREKLPDLARLRLGDLQPTQFLISKAKLAAVRRWFRPDDLTAFPPLPVKMLDGAPVLTDGHTRACAAALAGLERVPLQWESEDLDWEMYRRCVAACRERGVASALSLADRIVPPEVYAAEWDGWCDRMQAEVLAAREKSEEQGNR